jgi:hypothetical protein
MVEMKKGGNMTTKQVDEQIAALKEKIHGWEQEKQSKQRHVDALAKQRDGLRSASLRNKDPQATAALQDARAAMSVAMLELDDLAAEIDKASAEVDELLQARKEAAQRECWEKFRLEAKTAEKQAQELEKNNLVTQYPTAQITFFRGQTDGAFVN